MLRYHSLKNQIHRSKCQPAHENGSLSAVDRVRLQLSGVPSFISRNSPDGHLAAIDHEDASYSESLYIRRVWSLNSTQTESRPRA